jgi:hypothetical protein
MYYENIADVCEHADDEYQEKLLTWITFHVRRSRGRCAQIWKADQLKNSNRWESIKGEYFIDEKVGFFITGGYVAFFLSYTVRVK